LVGVAVPLGAATIAYIKLGLTLSHYYSTGPAERRGCLERTGSSLTLADRRAEPLTAWEREGDMERERGGGVGGRGRERDGEREREMKDRKTERAKEQ